MLFVLFKLYDSSSLPLLVEFTVKMFAFNSISTKPNAKQIANGPQRLPAVALIKMAMMAANNASARPTHPVNPCILMRIRYANAVAYRHLCPAVILPVWPSVPRSICLSVCPSMYLCVVRCHSTGRNYCYSNWSGTAGVVAGIDSQCRCHGSDIAALVSCWQRAEITSA